MDRFWRIPKIT